MQRFKLSLVCAAAGLVLSACTQGATGPPSLNVTNPLATGKLQLAVGTANIEGSQGLNVVATYRQANGDSNVLLDTPTITGPFTYNFVNEYLAGGGFYAAGPGGPSYQEFTGGSPSITGTSQFLTAGTPECDTTLTINGLTTCPAGVAPNTTTFGQAGGVFAMGLAPYNSNINGTADSYTPYPDGLYDITGDTFTPWGGPPAFDPNKDGMGIRDGSFDIVQILGIGMGITAFEAVTPGTGSYTMSVVVPTSPKSSGTVTASATLNSAAFLPTPASPSVVLDGLGGGTFTVTLPAGATEGYVEVEDIGDGGTSCQGPTGTQAFPVYYTMHVTASGAATLPDTDGPNTNVNGGPTHKTPSPSICTAAQNTAANGGTSMPGDTFGTWFIAMDYPLYAASPTIGSASQSPTLVGANGQADIATSPLFTGTSAIGVYHGVRPLTKAEFHGRLATWRHLRATPHLRV